MSTITIVETVAGSYTLLASLLTSTLYVLRKKGFLGARTFFSPGHIKPIHEALQEPYMNKLNNNFHNGSRLLVEKPLDEILKSKKLFNAFIVMISKYFYPKIVTYIIV